VISIEVRRRITALKMTKTPEKEHLIIFKSTHKGTGFHYLYVSESDTGDLVIADSSIAPEEDKNTKDNK
jgi:hypothetical protein